MIYRRPFVVSFSKKFRTSLNNDERSNGRYAPISLDDVFEKRSMFESSPPPGLGAISNFSNARRFVRFLRVWANRYYRPHTICRLNDRYLRARVSSHRRSICPCGNRAPCLLFFYAEIGSTEPTVYDDVSPECLFSGGARARGNGPTASNKTDTLPPPPHYLGQGIVRPNEKSIRFARQRARDA